MRHSFPFVPQELIAGKYLPESLLGEGRTGVVFRARHCELGHRVAIKVLRPEFAQRGEIVERFRRQASSAASLRSEHVCRVLDVTALDNWLPCVVMEHLEGQDLAQALATRKTIPVHEALEYALQACAGLGAGLEAGMVHRALAPSKLFLARCVDGSICVKVLGLGSDAGLVDSQLTAADGVRPYLAPEQLRDPTRVDARTNVWALGTILLELIGEQALPPELARVLERACAQLAELRYATVLEFAGELASCLALAPRPAQRFPGWLIGGVYVAAIGAALYALRCSSPGLERRPQRPPPPAAAQVVAPSLDVTTLDVTSLDASVALEVEPEPVLPRSPPLQPAKPRPAARVLHVSDFGGRR